MCVKVATLFHMLPVVNNEFLLRTLRDNLLTHVVCVFGAFSEITTLQIT